MTRKVIFRIGALLASFLALASAASGYEVVTVTGGGAIQGKVMFTGAPPPPRKETRTKNPEVCGQGVFEVSQMVLAPDKTVGDVVVFLKHISNGKALEKPAKPPEIVNHKCSFVPHIQAVAVGDIVVVNSDDVLHNTHGYYGRITVFNLALPNLGQRITKRLPRPGLVKVDCDAHGWMLAWVYVFDNPYYAVTGKDGAFTMKDVPPGSYTLVAWQEFTGPVEVPVTVKGKEVVSITVDLKK